MGQGSSKVAPMHSAPTFADRAFEIASLGMSTSGPSVDPRLKLRSTLWLFAWEHREQLGYDAADAPVPAWDDDTKEPLTLVDMWLRERCVAGLAPTFPELLHVITLLASIGGPAWAEFEKHVEKRVLDFHLDRET
jgi:hypothetical protein